MAERPTGSDGDCPGVGPFLGVVEHVRYASKLTSGTDENPAHDQLVITGEVMSGCRVSSLAARPG